MLLGNTGQVNRVEVHVNDIVLKPKSCVKLLGVKIDSKLTFSEHVKTLCKSASGKVKALFSIRPYLNIYCVKRLCEVFILSTFN